MPIAEKQDTDLNLLSDNELDDVNGGILPIIGAVFVGAAVGSAVGYLIGRGLVCLMRH